jgi:hypothetical protein
LTYLLRNLYHSPTESTTFYRKSDLFEASLRFIIIIMPWTVKFVDGPFVSTMNRLAQRQRRKQAERKMASASPQDSNNAPGSTRVISVTKIS